MLDQYISCPQLLAAISQQDALKCNKYLSYLELNGYCVRSIRDYVGATVHFESWRLSQPQSIKVNIHSQTSKFLEQHLPICQCPKYFQKNKITARAALNHWLRIIYPDLVPLNVTPHSIRINLYDSYLLNEIGLSLSTRRTRRRHIEEFLTWLLPCHAKSLEVLSSKHLNSYMSSISKTKSPLTTAVAVTSLKCFLAFSSAKGDCPPNLCHGILRPKMIHSISTTNSLTEGELNRLIGAFDCSRDLGRRDYAMARCLIDLGLRTDDVAHISLNHINWHNGTITLAPGKSNCGRIVPLPPTTAKALLDYLQYGRPVTKEQYVFVYHCAPVGKAVLSSTIRQALRRAFKRAGFADSESQVHRIRHTMATRLLDQNIPIKIIADVLGHACIETTTRYTHISRSMLSDVAMDWQGGGIEL